MTTTKPLTLDRIARVALADGLEFHIKEREHCDVPEGTETILVSFTLMREIINALRE